MSRLMAAGGALALLLAARPAPLGAQVSPGPLARSHSELEGTRSCTRCHGPGKDAMQTRCLACHRDIGWLADRRRGAHGSVAYRGKPCATCHPDHAGADFALIKWPGGSPDRLDHATAGWPLEQSHAKAKCADCHAAPKRVSPAAALAPGGVSRWTGLEQRCTACHEDPHNGSLSATCTDCHDAGAWSATPGFSHDSTAYPLTGLHRKVGCNDCHLTGRRDLKGRPVPVYKPLSHAGCASCHKDPHGGRLGGDCASCHTTGGFGEAGVKGFDHARTRFPLRGRHAGVRCESCHRDLTSEAGRRPASATCAACHADPHGTALKSAARPADCAACHTESGFAPSTWTAVRHRSTRYPLEGKHRGVACASCHPKDRSAAGLARWGSAGLVLRPAFARCLDCHQQAHGAQLAARKDGGECSVCHRVEGWAPSRVDAAGHAQLGWPLDGRHAAVPCRACHGADRRGLPPPGDAAALGTARFAFAGPALGSACAACHADPHAGRYQPGGGGQLGGCTDCHDTRAFAPATVDVARHQRFRFPLEGEHRATPCTACHQELGRPRPPGPVSTLVAGGGRFPKLEFQAPRACESCHTVKGSERTPPRAARSGS